MDPDGDGAIGVELTMANDSGLLILVGAMLLLGGLVAVVKVWMWVWLVGRMTHHPSPPRTAVPTSLDSFKKFLALISTLLGIVTTCVGLVRECGWMPDREESRPATPAVSPPPAAAPTFEYQIDDVYQPPPSSMVCCTAMGNCMMVYPAVVGTQCFCTGMMGAAVGTVCPG
jgi:hypothetical protein